MFIPAILGTMMMTGLFLAAWMLRNELATSSPAGSARRQIQTTD